MAWHSRTAFQPPVRTPPLPWCGRPPRLLCCYKALRTECRLRTVGAQGTCPVGSAVSRSTRRCPREARVPGDTPAAHPTPSLHPGPRSSFHGPCAPGWTRGTSGLRAHHLQNPAVPTQPVRGNTLQPSSDSMCPVVPRWSPCTGHHLACRVLGRTAKAGLSEWRGDGRTHGCTVEGCPVSWTPARPPTHRSHARHPERGGSSHMGMSLPPAQ